MGVLAVAQGLHDVEVEEELLGQPGLTAHIFGYVRVILCGVGVGFCREAQACSGSGVAVSLDLLDDAGIVIRITHHGHIAEVLGSRTQHRGPAYVDILDSILHSHTLFGDCGLEGIEIDTHHVDQANAVLFELAHVVGQVAATEQTAVYLGVKCLDAAIADFRESGDVADIDYCESGIAQGLHGAPGGDDVPAHVAQGSGELHYPTLI